MPRGIENLKHDFLGFAEEDIVVEVITQRMLIEHGIVRLVFIVDRGLSFRGTRLQVGKRDEILVRG